MPLIRIELPELHQAQREVVGSAKRFNVLTCGRRWGKTRLGIDRLIRRALEGKPVGWFAPAYKYLTPVWREIQERLAPVTKWQNQQEHVINLITGGSVEMWSLDSTDAGRSRAYAEVVIDEAALVPALEEAWQQSIRPSLADYQGGAWFFSTPKGTANYFYHLYNLGSDNLKTDWSSWQMPTAANPYIMPSEIEAAKDDLTDLAFAQEYLAQFVSWAGSVFRRITDAVHQPAANMSARVIGVDWGRTGDYTVFTPITDKGHVLEIDRFRGIEYALQRQRLIALWERLGRPLIIPEFNSMGGPIVEQLQREGLPVYPFLTSNATKTAAIESLALAFERGTIKIPNDPALIGELQSFEAKPLPTGLMRYQAPAGSHDDCVMSLAIAWAGLGYALNPPRDEVLFVDPNTGELTRTPSTYQISSI